MQFSNQYRDHQRFITNPGDPIYPIFKADEDGQPVKVGEKNLYDEIQSHRESVELSTLLQRYAAGDESALNKYQGVYEDVVDAPKTLADMYAIVNESEEDFRQLPEAFRKLFKDDFGVFARSIGTEEYIAAVTKYAESIKNSSKSGSGKSAGSDPAGGDVDE